MTYAKPLPVVTELSRPFWDMTRQSILSIQVCDKCGDRHYPEAPVCPKCLSDQQSWKPVSGKGSIWSWVVYHRGYWDSFKDDLPYTVAIVELDEGPLFATNLLPKDKRDFNVGDRVEVVFEPVTDEITLPKFKPAG